MKEVVETGGFGERRIEPDAHRAASTGVSAVAISTMPPHYWCGPFDGITTVRSQRWSVCNKVRLTASSAWA